MFSFYYDNIFLISDLNRNYTNYTQPARLLNNLSNGKFNNERRSFDSQVAAKQDSAPSRPMPMLAQPVAVGNGQEQSVKTPTYSHQLAQLTAMGYQFPMAAPSVQGVMQPQVLQASDSNIMGDIRIPSEIDPSVSGQNQVPFHPKPMTMNHLPNHPVDPSLFMKTPKNPYWKCEPKFLRNKMEEPATHVQQQEFESMLQQV